MKSNVIKVFIIISIITVWNCDDDSSTGPNKSVFELLTDGTWVVTDNTELGIPGVRIKYNTNYQADQFINGNWYYANYNWQLENNDSRLVLTHNYDNSVWPYDIELIDEKNMILIARDNYYYGEKEIWQKIQ